MPDLNFQQIGQAIAELATRLFQSHVQTAISDGQQFARDMEQHALRLVRDRAAMTPGEFEDAKINLLTLARMERIKQQGLAKVTIDRFTQGVVDIVLEAAEAAL